MTKGDLPWDEPPARLQFAPGESPYDGVHKALARIREGMAGLDKYIGALERDLDVFEKEWASARTSPEAAERPTRAAKPVTAQAPTTGGKSWRDRP